MKKQKSGFTLVELLIVLAIILILAAVIFPVFNNACHKARQTDCQTNLKQLSLACMMYRQECEEAIPDSSFEAGFGLEQAISPYLPDEKSLNLSWFVCGEDNRESLDQDQVKNRNSSKFSYGWNVHTLRQAAGRTPDNGPSVPLIFDATTNRVNQPCLPPPKGVSGFAPLDLRHHGGLNVAFFDGHVKWLGQDAIKSGQWKDDIFVGHPIVWQGAYSTPVPKPVKVEASTPVGFPEKVTGVDDGVYLFKVTGGKLEKVAGPLKEK